jgi:hypothetical protein
VADLSNLDNGLYLIKIHGKKGKIYQNKIIKIREARRHNTGLAKVAVQCSADPEVSGWLIKV